MLMFFCCFCEIIYIKAYYNYLYKYLYIYIPKYIIAIRQHTQKQKKEERTIKDNNIN